MSRCFPYPPPGYTRKEAGFEAALIESIKLHSERKNSKKDMKKDKSGDKKHKSKESGDKKHKSKEHKRTSRGVCDTNLRKDNDLEGQTQEKIRKETKKAEKRAKDEVEQLEKSGLTEEHGQQVWPQSPGYLSDGTQSSHKRKRDVAQPNQGSQPGNIIRIKLTPRKHQEQDSSLHKDQACSTSGRDKSLDQQRDGKSHELVKAKTSFTNTGTGTASNATLKPRIPVPDVNKEITSRSNDVLLPAESVYEAQFGTWIPKPPPLLLVGVDNEEWLFGTRRQDVGHATNTNKAVSNAPSCRSSNLWPRAQYLPEADVYSLPYTIPF